LALTRIGNRSKSFPSHGANGSSSCSLSLVGDTATMTAELSAGGATKPDAPGSKPRLGSSSPEGATSLNGSPAAPTTVSVAGSKSSRPASASATTVSGEVTNANVDFKPSLRWGKLRLYDVTMVLAEPSCTSSRCH